MSPIDLIVLGIVKNEPLSAYDIQKAVEYRNISRWVKISTPSIYKKVLQLEEKGLILSAMVREGNMPEKAVYSLTGAGEAAFRELMFGIASQPVNIFLDMNAVMVNLPGLPAKDRKRCLAEMEKRVRELKGSLEENVRQKENLPEIREAGKAVLRQQLLLAEAIETWLASVRESSVRHQ
jgi:DNA-binding PadR family transcriptional regulator